MKKKDTAPAKTNNKNKKDDLGKNVVQAPSYIVKKHPWSAVKFTYTVLPVVLAAVIELVISLASLWGNIADLANQLVTLISGEHFDKLNTLTVGLIVTAILLIFVIIAWIMQKNICDEVVSSTTTSFYRIKDGEAIVIHKDEDGQKMFTMHGVLNAKKLTRTVGRLEVFYGIFKLNLQPLLKRHIQIKNAKAKKKGKEPKYTEYADVAVEFIGGEKRVFYNVDEPDKFIEYLGTDTFSASSEVTYKVSKKI